MATWHLFSKGRGFTERVGVFVGGTGGDWSHLLSGEKQAWRPGRGGGGRPEGIKKKAELGPQAEKEKGLPGMV